MFDRTRILLCYCSLKLPNIYYTDYIIDKDNLKLANLVARPGSDNAKALISAERKLCTKALITAGF